jgi:RNA polymerase sigma-70 factor (ECF subfamily)
VSSNDQGVVVDFDKLSPEKLIEAIHKGDAEAETAFCEKYRRGLLLMLQQRTGDRARAEDIAQETLLTVLLKLRNGGIDEPSALNRYVQQTAKYTFIGWLRKSDNKAELRESVDDIEHEDPSAVDIIWQQRRRQQVREAIKQLKVPRDRELLFRYYVKEQSKPYICDALELSPAHFDRVINRARNRFKNLASERFDHGF